MQKKKEIEHGKVIGPTNLITANIKNIPPAFPRTLI